MLQGEVKTSMTDFWSSNEWKNDQIRLLLINYKAKLLSVIFFHLATL